MSHVRYHRHTKESLIEEKDTVIFKIRPTFPAFQHEEYCPSQPCHSCFPKTECEPNSVERVGVYDLLNEKGLDWKSKALSYILKGQIQSIQVHRGEVEHLEKLGREERTFLAHYQSPLDYWILSYMAQILHCTPRFVDSWLIPKQLSHFLAVKQHSFASIANFMFINPNQSKKYLEHSCVRAGIPLIPISLSYEFPTGNFSSSFVSLLVGSSSAKPNVRINFGHQLFLEDFHYDVDLDESMFIRHIIHEIWKNSSIMAFHILSVAQYRASPGFVTADLLSDVVVEFQKNYDVSHDLAFVGCPKRVSDNCLELYGDQAVAALSNVAVDLLKLESIMMKALLSIIDLNVADRHNEKRTVSQDLLLATYDILSGILVREIDFLLPPCENQSRKQALASLMDRSIISHHSDQTNSGENHQALRIARHLDLDSSDDEEEYSFPKDVPLYVDVDSLLQRKWVANIADCFVEIYHAAASQLLELYDVDVIEDMVYVNSVLQSLSQTFSPNRFTRTDLRAAVERAIQSFIDAGLIAACSHRGLRVIYLADPLVREGQLLTLIEDISRFLG